MNQENHSNPNSSPPLKRYKKTEENKKNRLFSEYFNADNATPKGKNIEKSTKLLMKKFLDEK